MIKSINITQKIPGIKESKTIIHISDVHLAECDEHDTEQIKGLSHKRKIYFSGALESLDDLKRYIIDSCCDQIVLTGDIIDFPSAKNIGILTDFLQNIEVPYLYVPGNHDWCYPDEIPDNETKEKALPSFYHLMNNSPEYQEIDMGEVLLIGIDDSQNQIDLMQLNKFKKSLSKGKAVLLFIHVPIYSETLIGKVMEIWRHPIMIGNPQNVVSAIYHNELIPDEYTKPTKALKQGFFVVKNYCLNTFFVI